MESWILQPSTTRPAWSKVTGGWNSPLYKGNWNRFAGENEYTWWLTVSLLGKLDPRTDTDDQHARQEGEVALIHDGGFRVRRRRRRQRGAGARRRRSDHIRDGMSVAIDDADRQLARPADQRARQRRKRDASGSCPPPERDLDSSLAEPPKGPPSADLTWGMAISLTILNSLRGRILALVLGLVILVLTAAIVGIAVTERAETERQVGAQLQTAADTARELLRFRGSQLTTAVEVLTSDFGFREAVSSADAATLTSAVENQQRRINADLVIVLSTNGRPLASTFNGSLANTQRDLEGLIETDASGETLQLYRLIDGRPYQLVIAPILAPNPIGWAAMGFALDDRVAEDMSRLLGVDVSFVAAAERYPLFIATSDHGDPRTLEGAVIRTRRRPRSSSPPVRTSY